MVSIPQWSSNHRSAFPGLMARVLEDESNSLRVGVARATSALPVYADMGGWLLLTIDGGVLEWSAEHGRVQAVEDPAVLRLASAAAADAFPELRSLRPTDGTACAYCGGAGYIGAPGARCGMCDGVGLSPVGRAPR